MKKLMAILLIAVLTVMSVAALDSQIVPNSEVAVPENGVTMVEFCVWETTQHVTPKPGQAVVLGEVCQEVNGEDGCQTVDLDPTGEFDVVLGDSVTGADGCVDVVLTTTNADGEYYFTINGVDSEAQVVTNETGHAFVPEMGVIGAAIVLAGAGLFIARKRN